MNIRHMTSISFMALTLAALGCATQSTAPGAAQPDPLPNNLYPQIAAVDGLDQYIVYRDVVVTTGPPMKVTVPVRAITQGEPLAIQYRYTFLDELGRPLNERDWRTLRLPSRTIHFLEASALDNTAHDWLLEIRRAR